MYSYRQAIHAEGAVCTSLLSMEESIFQVTINETGELWIRRFHRLASVILVATILVSGANLLANLILLMKANQSSTFPASARWRNIFFTFYLAGSFFLQVTQVVFYKRFAGLCRKAIDVSDAFLFNHSFRWLYLQALCFFIQIMVSLAYFVATYFFVYRF